ncbi:extracellular solute-binding protein [Devosia sp. FKR38]|uniref:ABC transporter substrate-binding protein n=1 Tax=Devosia sp. FKR38 TaxID=2562312 RepID=UPI0010C11B3D|nr:extracellular solute-binding protein [Devosia sp. FKR38]
MKLMKLGTIALALSTAMLSPVFASELKLMWYVDGDEQEAKLRGLLDQYTAANPDTTFDLQIVPYETTGTKFQQFAASGSFPDVSLSSSMPPIIRPFLVDWAEVNGPEWIDQFVAGWADGAKLDSKVIAAPLDVTAVGIYYNADAFAKAGVEIPADGWTWDEALPKFKEVAEKAGVRFPLVWDVSAHRFLTYEFQYGNHVFSEDEPLTVAMDDASWEKTMDQFIAMANEYMPPGLWSGASSDSPVDMFVNQQAVAYMSGSWQIGNFGDNAKFKWVAGPTPKGTVASSNVGGNYLLAFNTSAHLEESTAFVNWMTSPEIQAVYAKTFGLLPANKNAPAVDYASADAQAAVVAFQKELELSPRYAATDQAWPEMQATWDSIKAGITQAYVGQITTKDAVAGIRAAAEAAIAAGR